MIVYLDTSVLIPLLLPEARSSIVRRWMAEARTDEMVVSAWTVTEFASALGVKVRFGTATAAAASRANTAFLRLVSRSFRVITPLHRDFADAAQFLQRFDLGLRAGDALHLAISRNHHAGMLATLDKRLVRAGAEFGHDTMIPG